MFFMSCFGFKI